MWTDLRAEIADLFALLSVPTPTTDGYVLDRALSLASRTLVLAQREASDPGYAAECKARRLAKHHERMRTDPAYAARKKAIAKRATQRARKRAKAAKRAAGKRTKYESLAAKRRKEKAAARNAKVGIDAPFREGQSSGT